MNAADMHFTPKISPTKGFQYTSSLRCAEMCLKNVEKNAANISSCLAEFICVSARVRRGEGQLLMLC